MNFHEALEHCKHKHAQLMTVGKLRYFQSEGQDIDWDQYGRGPFRINAKRLDGYWWHEILPFEHYRDYYEVFS